MERILLNMCLSLCHQSLCVSSNVHLCTIMLFVTVSPIILCVIKCPPVYYHVVCHCHQSFCVSSNVHLCTIMLSVTVSPIILCVIKCPPVYYHVLQVNHVPGIMSVLWNKRTLCETMATHRDIPGERYFLYYAILETCDYSFDHTILSLQLHSF